MSRSIFLAKAIVIAWIASLPVCAWAAGGYVFDAQGVVTIAADKRIAPRLAVKHDAVASGTVIRTGDNSHAVLKFEDGQVVSMQANSTFQVREYRYEPRRIEQSSIIFSMFKGGMRFLTGQIGLRNKQAFRLATPNTTIGIRGTEFMVVMANNSTYSHVLSGGISMTNAAGMVDVTAGQKALTPSATKLTTLLKDSSVPSGIFSQIASIPVPAAVASPVPPPPAIPLASAATSESQAAVIAAMPGSATATAAATTATTTTTAGGAAAGGAAAGTGAVAGGASTGISATTIGIGIGVAAIAAAAAGGGSSSATQH